MTKKKKNSKKKKLSSLILLLLFTVIMLGTAAYAWFTSNKNVSVEGIDIQVAATSGLQISTDGTTWKTTISNTDITSANWTGVTNQMPTEGLSPVSTAGLADADESTIGAIDMYDGTVENYDGDLALTTTKHAAEANTTTSGHYVAFDMFIKTEQAADIYLTDAAGVTVSEGKTDTGLQNASRVAFVIEGNKTADTAVGTIRALNGVSNVIFWEPNYDVHTSYGVTQASNYYNISSLAQGAGNAKVTYDGVKAAKANVLLANTNATSDSATYQAVTTIETAGTPTAYTKIFSLAAGVTKIRTYFWVEGQDVDCENNASGSGISLNIALSTNSAAPTA